MILLRQHATIAAHDPQAGSVQSGGLDLTSLDPEAIRSQIAMVRQDTYLFHGTVDDNLRMGKPDATRAEIIAAARAAKRMSSSPRCRRDTRR